MRKKTTLSTEEIFQLIKDKSCFSEVSSLADASFNNQSASEYLLQLIAEREVSKQDVIRLANIERSYGYQIFRGTRTPSRDVLLSISIVMQLSVEETQHLLRIFNRGALYPKIKRDAAIIYCLCNGLNLIDTEILLDEIKQSALTRGKT